MKALGLINTQPGSGGGVVDGSVLHTQTSSSAACSAHKFPPGGASPDDSTICRKE